MAEIIDERSFQKNMKHIEEIPVQPYERAVALTAMHYGKIMDVSAERLIELYRIMRETEGVIRLGMTSEPRKS